jgi:DNA invertase Pin-like site-specific DNA recombinase
MPQWSGEEWVQLGSTARAAQGRGCKRIYEDTASGAKVYRPNLIRMLDKLHTGDVVVV